MDLIRRIGWYFRIGDLLIVFVKRLACRCSRVAIYPRDTETRVLVP
jgi:hypothetical protein